MSACPSCGAWFVWPPPEPEQLVAHYESSVSGMPAELRAFRAGTSQGGWYEHLASRMARIAGRSRSIDEIESVADVGAGGLELTAALAHRLPTCHVQAFDLFADGAEKNVPDGLKRRVSLRRLDLNRLERTSLPGETFDVVACVAVIEHVLDPVMLLRFLRLITAPGGFTYVAGPEVTSPAHRILGRRWPYYSPDDHLTLPSLESVRRALQIAGGGEAELRRINVHYSLQYVLRYLRLPLPLPGPLDLLLPVPAGAFELIWRKPPRQKRS